MPTTDASTIRSLRVRTLRPLRFALSAALAAAAAVSASAATAADPAPASKLSAEARAAIARAVQDERNAQRFYEAVIAKHGKVRPFTNVLVAQRRHEAELVALAGKHGVELPAAGSTASTAVPETLAGACEAAVAAERDNAALMEKLSRSATERDVRTALERVAAASGKRHLPAFQKCVDAGGAPPPAQKRAAAQSGVQANAAAAPTCGSCGMGGCGCGAQSAAEKAARAAQAAETGKPAGCGCARARQQQTQQGAAQP